MFPALCFLGKNDMQVLAKYYQEKKETNMVDSLPMIMLTYVEDFGL